MYLCPVPQIDQAALTGESLPVKKFTGDVAFSGSTVKQGERHALVYATGGRQLEKEGSATFAKCQLPSGVSRVAHNMCMHAQRAHCLSLHTLSQVSTHSLDVRRH